MGLTAKQIQRLDDVMYASEYLGNAYTEIETAAKHVFIHSGLDEAKEDIKAAVRCLISAQAALDKHSMILRNLGSPGTPTIEGFTRLIEDIEREARLSTTAQYLTAAELEEQRELRKDVHGQ